MANPKQVETPAKKRGKSREELMRISAGTQWKKGQSGNPRGMLGEKAISEGLKRFYSDNPKEFARLLSAAHKKASAAKPHPKFWELVADRVEGKVAAQIAVSGNFFHSITDLDKKNASLAIESIRAFDSENVSAIAGELAEEIETQEKKTSE
jgi:hypothetical protein